MWVNEMLTIWLYGTVFSLIVCVTCLLIWYKPEKDEEENNKGD